MPWIFSGSPTMAPAVIRGLREPIGVLEYRLDLPAHGLHPIDGSDPAMFVPRTMDGAFRRLVELHDQLADCRLAAAALADQSERFAWSDVERDAVDGVDERHAPNTRYAWENASPDLPRSERRSGFIGQPPAFGMPAGGQMARTLALQWRRLPVRHLSVAREQRSENRQPGGRSVRAGTTPGISFSSVRPTGAGMSETRQCAEQAAGVGMARIAETPRRLCLPRSSGRHT